MTDVAAPAVELLSPAFYGDLDGMHAAFRWLRAHDPVHRDEANGLWGVTRHADVMDVRAPSRRLLLGPGLPQPLGAGRGQHDRCVLRVRSTVSR